jgi:diguanylate cyclase (GGDEF)-like protein
MKKRSPSPEVLQQPPQDAAQEWTQAQEQLAADEGLSLLLVEGHQPPALVASQNNSICHAFQSSPEHVKLCDPYCGDAHRRALAAGTVTEYKCHAGLHCFAMPVQIGRRKNLAAIGGRAFFSAEDYRVLLERFRKGELEELLAFHPFANVIFTDQSRLRHLADRVEKLASSFNGSRKTTPSANQEDATVTTAARRAEVGTAVERSKPASQPDAALIAEVERLRGEIDYRTRLNESLQHFLERISSSDPEKTYTSILNSSSELLSARRASLMVFDELSNELVVRAAVGLPVPKSELGRMRLGEEIAGKVLESSRPMVVSNIDAVGIKREPGERKYKTKSFISYPITIGGRRIGVLNVTDKTGGTAYNEVDLSLLEIIGPQIAVALERAEWQERATEFQLMSITDPLTSLPNRRYLEERLMEELSRSKRYDYPMSFLMIDIDDFKSYNDLNGHQAGDLALQITAHCLKATLRSADVASRYGGEEFCILLPQTPLNEAAAIAERVRQRVASTTYPHGKSQPLGMVTISIGISTYAKHIDTPERVIAAADRALYSAKSEGKNRIEIYQEV